MIELAVEANSDPSSMTDVRWIEESLWLALDERLLRSFGGGTPEVRELVVVVSQWPEHHELLRRKESWRAVALALGHLR